MLKDELVKLFSRIFTYLVSSSHLNYSLILCILECSCSSAGSKSSQCEPTTGECHCKPNYAGPKCNQCASGFYGYPDCQPCECNAEGSSSTLQCNEKSGQCPCKSIYSGRQCDRCLSGFYGFPDCKPCKCNPAGTQPEQGQKNVDCRTVISVSCFFPFICVLLLQVV